MKYRHLFFDLDHTLWDFEANSKFTLKDLYHTFNLQDKGVHDFDKFHQIYLAHNGRLWERYRNGHIKVEELRWKRMWLTLLDFQIGDQALAREMGIRFLDLLPMRRLLFPHTVEILDYLTDKKYSIHIITNGFDNTQHRKLKNAGIDKYFGEVITSESCNSLKPHKEIFDYALKKTGADKNESIMIGDSIEVDIQGAINSAWDQVYVNHLHELTAVKPTYTIYSLKELANIF